MPIQIHEIRWLGRLSALEAFVSAANSLREYLSTANFKHHEVDFILDVLENNCQDLKELLSLLR